jgi:hypothetical protein
MASTGGVRAWLGAAAVLVLAVVLVALDLSAVSVQRYWSRHAFTSSVLSGLLVLLLTVLIVDRVTHFRQQRNQSRAIAAQAAMIVAQATRTADAIGSAGSDDEREAAADELRTYMMMLLISAPLLIDATNPRLFLEAAQRLAYVLSRSLRAMSDGRQQPIRIDDEVQRLRQAAAPLAIALKPEERAAVDPAQESAQE